MLHNGNTTRTRDIFNATSIDYIDNINEEISDDYI